MVEFCHGGNMLGNHYHRHPHHHRHLAGDLPQEVKSPPDGEIEEGEDDERQQAGQADLFVEKWTEENVLPSLGLYHLIPFEYLVNIIYPSPGWVKQDVVTAETQRSRTNYSAKNYQTNQIVWEASKVKSLIEFSFLTSPLFFRSRNGWSRYNIQPEKYIYLFCSCRIFSCFSSDRWQVYFCFSLGQLCMPTDHQGKCNKKGDKKDNSQKWCHFNATLNPTHATQAT